MVNETEPRIIPLQLKRARSNLALSIKEVASTIGVEPDELFKWEQGISEPQVDQLWALAKTYHRSTDYFLRQTPALPEKLSFRLATQKEMAELPLEAREALIRFDELCRAEMELEKLLGKTNKVVIEKTSEQISPNDLATRERKGLGLGEKPIKNLRESLTRVGIRVFMLPVLEKRLSGMSWWHDEYGPCILVNAYDEPRGRRNFTLAHEYAHLVKGEPPTLCDLSVDDAEERFANAFASSFLMPDRDLERAFHDFVGITGTLPNDKQIGILANRYNVSLEALGRRLEELELIQIGSTDQYIAKWRLKPRIMRGAKRPVWRRHLAEKFVSLALEAHSKGYISLGKLAQYLGQDVRVALDESEHRTKPSGPRS